MALVKFKTDAGEVHTFDSLHFNNYFANAKTEKQILEALDSPFLSKGKYTIEWDFMTVDDYIHMATILLNIKEVGNVIEPIDKIEKYKIACKEAGLTSNITWKEEGVSRTRPKTKQEMRDELVIKELRIKIEDYMKTKKYEIHARILTLKKVEKAERVAAVV